MLMAPATAAGIWRAGFPGPREAKSMDRDRSFSAIPGYHDGVGPAAEQMDVFGKDEFLRYLR
jgi:hypothetical protein